MLQRKERVHFFERMVLETNLGEESCWEPCSSFFFWWENLLEELNWPWNICGFLGAEKTSARSRPWSWSLKPCQRLISDFGDSNDINLLLQIDALKPELKRYHVFSYSIWIFAEQILLAHSRYLLCVSIARQAVRKAIQVTSFCLKINTGGLKSRLKNLSFRFSQKQLPSAWCIIRNKRILWIIIKKQPSEYTRDVMGINR